MLLNFPCLLQHVQLFVIGMTNDIKLGQFSRKMVVQALK